MHTPAPAELFIPGALPGSGSFAASSPISAYQHPGSFSGRSFTPSLTLQDARTFSPTANGLLSPHDPLLHIKAASQSTLDFDRLLTSQSAAYRDSQESPAPPQTQVPPTSSSCHLPPHQFNLLSSQLHNQSSQLYNASMFSSTSGMPPAAPLQLQLPPDRAVSRQDSVIKHYQSSPPAHSSALQQYASCGGSSDYQQIVSRHHQAGMSCSPLGERSPPTEPKPSQQMESQTYQPIIQSPYAPSSSSSSAPASSATKGPMVSTSSTSGYSSSSSASSSSRTPHTPPSGSSTSSSSKTSSDSLSALSCQQPPPPPLQVSSICVQQPSAKQCLSNYGSQSVANSSTGLSDQTPPRPHSQSYSPSQPPSSHMAQSFKGFSSPTAQDLNSGAGLSGVKAYTGVGSGGRSFSAEIVFEDPSFGSSSIRRASSPSLGYGTESARSEGISGAVTHRSGVGSAGSGSETVDGNENTSSYHLPRSNRSPVSSTLNHPVLQSPTVHPAKSPGGSAATKYMPSVLSPAFMPSPQGFPDTRPTQSQSYHSTATKPKTETNLLAAECPQHEEEDADEFLIQHLLHTQTTTPQLSQRQSHSQQLPQSISQSISQARDEEDKAMSYDINRLSDDRYHPHSVIRTNNSIGTAGTTTAISDTTSGLNRQLEVSQKKQQTKSELASNEGFSKSLSHNAQSHQQQHESLGSVVHYRRGDPYTQQPHSQHPHHTTAHSQSCTQQISQHARHTQHPQHSHHLHSAPHLHSHSHMELKKLSNTNDSGYLCNAPDAQQALQSQGPLSLMASSPELPQSTHMLQSVLSHTTHTKMDSQQVLSQQQQQQQQHHSLSQQGIMGAGPGGVESHSQNQSSQLQLKLQNHCNNTHYSLTAQTRDQNQGSQNSLSPLDMLDQSLSQASSLDSGGLLDRTSVGVTVPVGEGDGGDRHRQQHRLTPHHHSQQKASELNNYLTEPDLGVSTPSHFHHLNQPQALAHSHTLHEQHAHNHHHTQLTHSHPHQMAANMETPQQQQPQNQTREHETQLTHSQLNPLKTHQFDSMSPVDKGQSQAQQQFPPLTSICFPDSLLQDEDRSFFPEMEDMFCTSDYKSSCTVDSRAGPDVQENLNQSHVRAQERIEALKAGGAGEGYDMVGHHSDQGYREYCHSLPGTGDGSLHLDLGSLKSHELPSTVNTDQLGLIQSQTPSLGLGSAAPGNGSANKMMGAVAGSSNTSGLTSPIFCSSRPKKLLKTSSFHLLKQRREPQPQTKKNYAQEYEFEDDEDKADAPADIRLNSRRLPDLLPDLVSSCRKAGGTSGVCGVSPIMGDMDFCHPSSYTSFGHPSPIVPHDGPKKRGRKPTKPKREGPPRPRGRPRIRPLPEPSYCRGLTGSGAGETRRGRGRGRGRGRREEGLVETHRDMQKAQNLPYQLQHQQQQYGQQQHLQQQLQQNYSQQTDLHQAFHQQPQHHLLHQQQQVSCSHHQLQHQQHHKTSLQTQQDPVRPIKVTKTSQGLSSCTVVPNPEGHNPACFGYSSTLLHPI